MAGNNEFLRQAPKKKTRGLLFDLTNLILPVLLIIIGVIISCQRLARLVHWDPIYCSYPIYILKKDFFGLPKGYPFFNPFVLLLTMFTNPFDQELQDAISIAFVPAVICSILGMISWVVIAIVRTNKRNKGSDLYGTARWGNEKDLKEFGLCEKHGVVLAMQNDAESEAIVNKAGNFALKIHKPSELVCHAGTSHTLLIAPTRSGKGVGLIVPTCVTYRESMIIFDPKGELYNMTGGYRSKFSHVIKFSPVQMETACFNPLEEVKMNQNAFRDIGTILTNLFQKSDKGGDSNSDFFDNNARNLLTGVIFHVLSAVDDNGKSLYGKEDKSIAGVLRILARAAGGEDAEGNPLPCCEALLDEMANSHHLDENGEESDYIHGIVLDIALSAKKQHEKVRSDIVQTIDSKLNLFRDPFIRNVTSHSDFKLQDFYDSKEPISLYLTLPFGDIDRIMPIFQLIIDFILRRFSAGELRAGEKESKLKHPILFLLDEFPTLGNMKFLATSMGVLAGYGLRFFIVVQAYQQLVKIYGQENTFIDNCRYIVIYAPNNTSDAERFSKMIGKESVVNDSISVSGSRFGIALNNINTSSQEVARDLINPDEMSKLPYTDAIVMCQGMPAYMAKKCAFYDDERFSWKVFFENQETGEIKSGFAAPYTQEAINAECAELPSQVNKKTLLLEDKTKNKSNNTNTQQQAKKSDVSNPANAEKEGGAFDPIAFLASCVPETASAKNFEMDDFTITEWEAPFYGLLDEGEPPPMVSNFESSDFDDEATVEFEV